MYKGLLLWFLCMTEAYVNDGLLSVSITRHHKGDAFIARGERCYSDVCEGLSNGTGEPNGEGECECKCGENRPVFRDDLNMCVDDIQECTLVPFASSTAYRKIPYVFLPLKGQIVYPSAEIVMSDMGRPVCVVSGGQYLGRAGWMNLRNHSGMEPPFRLFRDEGRTYLQWLGDGPLRMAMEGRIILVHLMCKDASFSEEPKIFTPCIAFRIAGNPSIKEVMFGTDVLLKEEYSGGLTVREYAAIGVCSMLLAVVYVTSVFFYLRWRRRNQQSKKKCADAAHLGLGEEGVVKSNPLLQASGHLGSDGHDNGGYTTDSNSCCSDADQSSDLLSLEEDILTGLQNVQTSAIIHPCDVDFGESTLNQESTNIEKLPEENVSIVETLEVKEDHSETLKSMGCANGRRKLYFNPSYFEPDLLKAPPPAALEFLIKIREVIAIAKHKMSSKKFSPSLLGIPEEEGSLKADNTGSSVARPDQEKKENFQSDTNANSDFRLLQNEFCCPMDAKQKIIRKWLEDVPLMIQTEEQSPKEITRAKLGSNDNKILNKSKLWQVNEEKMSNVHLGKEVKIPTPPIRQDKKRPSTKGKAPPLPVKSPEAKPAGEPAMKKDFKPEFSTFPFFHPSARSNGSAASESCNSSITQMQPPRPPPLPSFSQISDEVPKVQPKDKIPPAVAKNLMDAVIQELATYKKGERKGKMQNSDEPRKEDVGDSEDSSKKQSVEAGTDANESPVVSTDGANHNQTETTSAPVESEQRFTKISNTKTMQSFVSQDDHEYEVILLNSEPKSDEKKSKDLKIYNLPEILCKNERNEGYSLVSEVYVNDGYSCCSGGSPPSSVSNSSSTGSDKIRYETLNEKPGRLTIHVNDCADQYKQLGGESDAFEPDTLDRKPRRSKLLRRINDANHENERYSNQKFHNMDCCKNSSSGNNEHFTDSLERPSIMLKTNGSFKRNYIERNIDDLFKNFNWSKVENFGSLREIYEAKNKKYRRGTETASLIDIGNNENDRTSTLSWSEERRNKLLHRGIVLHIEEGSSRKHKTRTTYNKSHESKTKFLERAPSRPPKPLPNPRSRSISPIARPNCESPSRRSPACLSPSRQSPRSLSPPIPPPRSLPASVPSSQTRSSCSSPVTSDVTTSSRKTISSPPPLSPRNNSAFKTPSKNSCTTPSTSACSSPAPSSLPPISSAPPRPPKDTLSKSPPLPPRNSKPPLPPKNSKSTKQRSTCNKLATRPLPPLPRPSKDFSSSPVLYRDPETLSTASGASMDSLNSSEYEAFYTLPYEEDEGGICANDDFTTAKNPNKFSSSSNVARARSPPTNQRSRDSEKKNRGVTRAPPHRPEDSGYLSTDSNESACPQIFLSSNFIKIQEKGGESYGSQNSETEESLCDGASESGAESIATDSFFYGNFDNGPGDPPQPYSLRLSDVEVNSDTERHCVPIMVRP